METAQKLNNPEKNIWGSFIGNDAVHGYMYATQSGMSAYNEDGTSNFDDPAFADSMKWFFSLGNDLKIQPSCKYADNPGEIPERLAGGHPSDAVPGRQRAVLSVH